MTKTYNVQAIATFMVEADSPEEAAELLENQMEGTLNAIQEILEVFDP